MLSAHWLPQLPPCLSFTIKPFKSPQPADSSDKRSRLTEYFSVPFRAVLHYPHLSWHQFTLKISFCSGSKLAFFRNSAVLLSFLKGSGQFSCIRMRYPRINGCLVEPRVTFAFSRYWRSWGLRSSGMWQLPVDSLAPFWFSLHLETFNWMALGPTNVSTKYADVSVVCETPVIVEANSRKLLFHPGPGIRTQFSLVGPGGLSLSRHRV